MLQATVWLFSVLLQPCENLPPVITSVLALELSVAVRRVRGAGATGAKALVTICPFCVRNLVDGAKLLWSSLEIVPPESLVAGLVVA